MFISLIGALLTAIGLGLSCTQGTITSSIGVGLVAGGAFLLGTQIGH